MTWLSTPAASRSSAPCDHVHQEAQVLGAIGSEEELQSILVGADRPLQRVDDDLFSAATHWPLPPYPRNKWSRNATPSHDGGWIAALGSGFSVSV
jgi:hypothetical protein